MSKQHQSLPPAGVSSASGLRQGRLDFIDNLRWVMIVLVVSMHAAVTYSHLGSWYFMEDPKPGRLVTILFAYYQMGLQAFFMGLLFFIAGYFVPGAYDRKGPARFLRDRFIRLGVPALFYMLAVHPFIVFWLLRGYYKITASFPAAYLEYLRSLRFVGSSGPMWFTVALFLFCVIYSMVRKVRPSAPRTSPEAPLPSHGQVAGLILVMSLCTFLVRTVQPMGTNILNMQLCFFSPYILLFMAGLLASRRNWLMRIRYEFGLRWLRWALTAGTILWLAAIGGMVATHTEEKLAGGFTWQSAAVCVWESFVCLGYCLGLIVLFREQFNWKGRFGAWMTENCFSVYLFHAPILIGVTLGMRGLAAPKPIKFLMATILGATASYLASYCIFRRVPLLRRVL